MSSSSTFLLPLGVRHHQYSRKQKSLGLLCTNFVKLYDKDGIDTVGLDDAASRLGVERRRIYDIVNVLESVGVLMRKAKNRYTWIGFRGIPKALNELKKEALQEIVSSPKDDLFSKLSDDDDDDDKSIDQSDDVGEEKLSQTTTASSSQIAPWKARSVMDNRKEKSLGLLTQNFVKLFLSTAADTISLDEAARLLLGDGHDSSYMRTKVRRLYDIANVLASLNLIEKTQQADTRKPAFRWLGTDKKPDNRVTVAIPPTETQLNKRVFGEDITNVDCKRTRLITSVIKRPGKEQVRNEDLKECNLTAQKQLQGSKGYVFGPFCPAGVAKGGSKADEKVGERVQDWESLATTFKPQYHNEALGELFAHYMEAWRSWYKEVAEGSNKLQQPYNKSILNQL